MEKKDKQLFLGLRRDQTPPLCIRLDTMQRPQRAVVPGLDQAGPLVLCGVRQSNRSESSAELVVFVQLHRSPVRFMEIDHATRDP